MTRVPDQDETDDAMDSLSWPDTSRPIISNNYPAQQPAYQQPPPGPDPFGYAPPPRRRWPVMLAGVALLAVLVVLVLIWLL